MIRRLAESGLEQRVEQLAMTDVRTPHGGMAHCASFSGFDTLRSAKSAQKSRLSHRVCLQLTERGKQFLDELRMVAQDPPCGKGLKARAEGNFVRVCRAVCLFTVFSMFVALVIYCGGALV